MFIVENTNPIMADSNENSIKRGLIRIKQLIVPNNNDKIPDNLNKFML